MDFFGSRQDKPVQDKPSQDNALQNKASVSGNDSVNLTEISGSLEKLNGLMDATRRQITDHLLSSGSGSSGSGAGLDQIRALLQPIIERLDGMGMLLSGGAAGSAKATGSAGSGASTASGASQDVVKGLFDHQNQALQGAFNSVDQKLDFIISQLGGGVNGSAVSGASVQSNQPTSESVSAPVSSASSAGMGMSASVSAPPVQAQAPVSAPAPAAVSGGISRAGLMNVIIGSEICGIPSLDFDRNELLDGVLRGEKSSLGLAGIMLQFHSATAERMPMLLKDVGEAFYRWHPKTAQGPNAFERALANYVCSCCEAVGIHNSIELVEIGQRFDTTRHNAVSRGVEIIEVKGWVVLRDNGKVYTRATVEVR